ncbi:MAG: acyl-CoA thioesterase domain-containing protein [Acidimicrobiia bacterium]
MLAESLVDLLTLEEIDTNLYRAHNPADQFLPNLYGGQVAAQALRAAAATVDDDRVPHSLHGYFLRPGRAERPTVLAVDRDRDGRSFSARHVNAIQEGKVIFSGLASFHVEEPGVDHQVPAIDADAGDPESMAEGERTGHNVLLDLRYPSAPEDQPWRSGQFWVRPRGDIPDDPVTRACVLTYLSDLGWAFGSLEAARGYGGPSLDHSVWLQRRVDVSGWVFVDLRPVTLAGSRGVFTGTIHDRAGTLAAYLTQESLLRGQE